MALDIVAIAVTDGNVQDTSDFWLFVVYILVVIVVVLFFLFYFNRVLGQILTWVVNQYTWRQYNAYIEVDSVRITLLGACILFKNLRYFSTNQSISVVKGHITIRYWLTHTRKSDSQCTEEEMDKNNTRPCRVVCHLQGVEWFIYNNVPAYENVKDILNITEVLPETPPTSSPSSSFSQQEDMRDLETQAEAGVEMSLIQRLMPIQFECTTGALMIGNNEIQSIIVAQAAQTTGIWRSENPRTPMDQRQSVIDMVLQKPQIMLKENMDYDVQLPTPQALSPAPRPETFSVSRLFAWLLYPFKLFHPASRTRQFGHMQHLHGITGSKETDRITAQSTTYHKEYARVKQVLECSKMYILYYIDIPGCVPSVTNASQCGIGTDIGNGGLPPEWGMNVKVWHAMCHYGPWTDRQRIALQDYFFPDAHRNNRVTPRRKAGQRRCWTEFRFNFEIMTEATLRVPTREQSKDWKYEVGSAELELGFDGFYTRPYGWIDIKVETGSTIVTNVPFVCGEDGYTSTVNAHLRKVDVSTSVNYASLMQVQELELFVSMHSPIQWNAHREWSFATSAKCPCIYLLRDHIFLLQDLFHDWTSPPPPDLLYFIPQTYILTFQATEPVIYLCVNEHNIISNPNSVEDNSFITLKTSKLRQNISLPFITYDPESNTIPFYAEVEHFVIGISLPITHTMNAFLSETNAQFGEGRHMSINGTYEFYTFVDILQHIESLNLHVKMDGVTCKLFGTVIRYLFILRDNYAGNWINFSTLSEYRQRRENQEEWRAAKRKQAGAKSIQDPFEVYMIMDVQNGSFVLPENLYDCSCYSQLEFQELQVELRNLDIYMDMYVSVSPLIWTRDGTRSGLGYNRKKHTHDPRNYLSIDALNIYAHRLFGPMPEIATYLCHWEFEAGRISGEVKPSFLLGIACFAQTFAHNLIDEDNAVPPEIVPAADPDVTFVKTTIRELDIFLTSHQSVTEMRLKDGLSFDFDNLVNEKYSQRFNLTIADMVIASLVDQDQYKEGLPTEKNFSWVEVAKVLLGVNVTIYRQTTNWRSFYNAQQSFIRSQDFATRRCQHLYQTDSCTQDSQTSFISDNECHVGVLYAPPYRRGCSFSVERRESLASVRIPSGPLSPDNVPSTPSHTGEWIPTSVCSEGSTDSDSDSFTCSDHDSVISEVSTNAESFYTAYSEDISLSSQEEMYDSTYYPDTSEEYSVNSYPETDSEDSLSTDESPSEEQTSDKSVSGTLIPSSIPYSAYLNRYAIQQDSSAGNCGRTFFDPNFLPQKTRFVPLHPSTEPVLKQESNWKFLFPQPANLHDFEKHTPEEATSEEGGNQVVMTTILEATRPLVVLMTPILVKIVQELSEAINKDEWDLETMLDSLQMAYVSQLTRYLTDQFICTRFAVSLPQMRCQIIQNVMMPDDLPFHRNDQNIKTQYDLNDHTLCTAEINIHDFSMIGSVKFQDLAYDEKQKSVAESNLTLNESRVHIDMGKLGCRVQYISDVLEKSDKNILFGIPASRQYVFSEQIHKPGTDERLRANELVVLDLELNGFQFQWFGSQKSNMVNLGMNGLSSILITEAIEILIGAVYSWLVFVDDLKGLLESFQNRRIRQCQIFIHSLATLSGSHVLISDPLFLTKPTNVLRLGSRNFRNDVGWKLLARMRHCLRSIRSEQRSLIQSQVSTDALLTNINTRNLFDAVVQLFSRWRSWEIRSEDIVHCRLFTQAFKDDNKVDKAVDMLIASLTTTTHVAKIHVGSIDVCIYEEEQSMDDNSLHIGSVSFALEMGYKRSDWGVRAIQDRPSSSEHTTSERSQKLPPTEGYLDVMAKVTTGSVHMKVNPLLMAFARHILIVKRVFTAKLKSISHTAKVDENLHPLEQQQGILQALLQRIDILAQALVTLDTMTISASVQKLAMKTMLRGLCGSILFSNPTLMPVSLFQMSDRAESDSGSGVKSSTKTTKRTANRLILGVAGGVALVDMQCLEMPSLHKAIHSLLAIKAQGVYGNLNVSQPPRNTRKQAKGERIRHALHLFCGIDRLHAHAPQSLARVFSFVQDWQSEQYRRYQFLFHNLIREWEEQNVGQPQTQEPAGRSFDLVAQCLLSHGIARIDMLPSLSVEYVIHDAFFLASMIQGKVDLTQQCSMQLTKQEIHLITRGRSSSRTLSIDPSDSAGGSFSIPSVRGTGRIVRDTATATRHQAMVFVDAISLTLDFNVIESLLTAQSFVVSEVNDLFEALSYAKANTRTSPTTLSTQQTPEHFNFSVSIILQSFCITAATPSLVCVVKSDGLEATVASAVNHSDRFLWNMLGNALALSLEQYVDGGPKASPSHNGLRQQLTSMVADCHVHNTPLSEVHLSPFNIELNRFHMVMQPIALGKLTEAYIYYASMVKKQQTTRQVEMDRLTSNTRRLVQTFKRGQSKQEKRDSSVPVGLRLSFVVRNLGIAIPLDKLDGAASKETRALLLSVVSLAIVSEAKKKYAATLNNTTLHFARKFDQNNAAHFVASKHARINHIAFPSLVCRINQVNDLPQQIFYIDAAVGGFEIDIDSTIAEYVYDLHVVYLQSKDHVEAFNQLQREHTTATPQASNQHDEIRIDMQIQLVCESGVVRMYPKRLASTARQFKTSRTAAHEIRPSDNHKRITLDIPGVKVHATYQTSLATAEPYRIHSDIAINASENTLHPLLIPFLREVLMGCEVGMQQLCNYKAVQNASPVTATTRHPSLSLVLRLATTQLDLSCQPASKVVCRFRWEEATVLIQAFSNQPASSTLSCVGILKGISGTVKHHFSPEACVTLTLDHVLFNTMLTTMRQNNLSRDDVTVAVHLPMIDCSANVRHLQDLLIVHALWFSQIIDKSDSFTSSQRPSTSSSVSSSSSSSMMTAASYATESLGSSKFSIKMPDYELSDDPFGDGEALSFARYMVLYIDTARFTVDLGHAIGKLTFKPEEIYVSMYRVPSNSKGIRLSIGAAKINAEGRLSGHATFHRILAENTIETPPVKHVRTSTGGYIPHSVLQVDGCEVKFEYEYQNLLEFIQRPFIFKSRMVLEDDNYAMNIDFRVQSAIARMSIKTVPVMITIALRLRDIVEKKKEEVRLFKSAANSTSPSPQKSDHKMPFTAWPTYSHVVIGIDAFTVILYPSQFQDPDNVALHIHRMQITLDCPYDGTTDATRRTLMIQVSFATLLRHVPGAIWMQQYYNNKTALQVSDLSGVSIISIPFTTLMMISTQLGYQVCHQFSTAFGGRVNVSLNLGLIRYLQELSNSFSAQLESARQRLDQRTPMMEHSTPSTPSIETTAPSPQLWPDNVKGTSLRRQRSDPNRRENSIRHDNDVLGIPSSSNNQTLSRKASSRSLGRQGIAKLELHALPENTPQVTEEPLVYIAEIPVDFCPQIQLMGDATPPVEWLGLKREKLPGLVHKMITLPLDKLVHNLSEMYQKQAQE